jgi:hypothetical protein
MEAYRQGDVSIMVTNRVPKQARRVRGEPILARGEVTGHAHRIIEGQVKLYQLATGILYLRVLSEFAKLYHEEHEDIVLPKGNYEVRRQREWEWNKSGRNQGGLRYVTD